MRPREPISLLVAALLHVALIGAVRVATRSGDAPRVADLETPKDDGVFELDEPPVEAAKKPEEPPSETPRVAARTTPRSTRIFPQEVRQDEPGSSKAAPAPEAAAAPAETVDARPPPAPLPGIDGTPIWAMPGILPGPSIPGRVAAAPAPVVPSAPSMAPTSPVGRAVQAGLDYLHSGVPPKAAAPAPPPPHFPAAGTFASAVADEIRGSSTPPESDSAFELIVDAQGHLVSARVVRADPRQRKEWERIANAVVTRFAGQTFPLPDAFVTGSRIRISVQSRMTMPDGTAHGIPKFKPAIIGLPKEGEIKEATLDDRYGGRILSNLPPVTHSLGLSIDFDIANLGAKRRRIIRTSVDAMPLAPPTSEGAADPNQ